MKKFLTSTGLIALSVSGLQAAPVLTPMESSKPWSVSVALRGFYDDNYTTSPDALADESFGYEVRPSVSLNLPFEQTFFGVSYEYGLKYYESRRSDDKYDQSHRFDLRLDHEFSERYKIDINNSLVVSQEPEVLSPSGGALATPLRTEGDNVRNLGSIDFLAQLTELLAVELGYANTFYDYEQDGAIYNPPTATEPASVTASRSGLLDRYEHEANIDFRWQALPETSGIFGYQFGTVDFTSKEDVAQSPTTGNFVSADVRNNRSHRVYVGADHRFSPQLNGSIRIGGQYTDYYNQDESSTSPYADASLAYQYSRRNHVQVGVNHSRNTTDVSALDANSEVTLDQESTAVYASLEHRITPNLVGSVLLQGQYSTFEGGAADGESEFFFISGLNLAYHFNPHLLAEAGYNFDDLDSDLSNRSFDRNRVYIGIRATY